MLASGGDPIVKRKAVVNAAPTFGGFADQFVETKAPGWRSAKHAQQWRRAITQHAAPLRRRPVDEITTEDVLAVLKPMWSPQWQTQLASVISGDLLVTTKCASASYLRRRSIAVAAGPADLKIGLRLPHVVGA
jgi:hypothetical protein